MEAFVFRCFQGNQKKTLGKNWFIRILFSFSIFSNIQKGKIIVYPSETFLYICATNPAFPNLNSPLIVLGEKDIYIISIYLFYIALEISLLFYRGTITICNGEKSPTLKNLDQLTFCQVKNETGSRKFHVLVHIQLVKIPENIYLFKVKLHNNDTRAT